MNYMHNFNIGTPINRVQNPMTLDDIRQYAPSALAIMPHESRSARYTYIPTVDILKGMEREGFLPFKATQSRCRLEGKREFTKHMIRFRHASMNQALAVGDTIPEVVLVNSHDGTSAYKLISGLFRLACSNGLMVSESELASITVMHKENVLDNVIEGSYRIVEQSQKALTSVNAWSHLQLTDGEQIAFADAARTLRFADADGNVNSPITAAQLLRPRRNEDVGNDLWRTMNRVQENVIKGGLRGRDANLRRVTTRAVNGIDQDVKLNRALWQLAERMTELKGVAAPVAA